MNTKLYIESQHNGKELLPLVQAAIGSEITKLKLALVVAEVFISKQWI